MNILQAIRERRSVRSFSSNPISAEMMDALHKAVEDSFSPFGGKISIRLKSFDPMGEFRPSTYGVIKGASLFFLISMDEDEKSALSVGFQFEQVVLKAWQMGLGTCWIAGTFKGSQFDRGEVWPEGESLRIVCPVGFPDKPRFMEKFMRMTVRSNNRLPFEKLFFEGDFNNPLQSDSPFSEALEMVRLAPSSTNSQPWRAVVDGNKVFFFGKIRNIVSVVDMGIALCHFYESETFNGHSGLFAKDSVYPEAPDNLKYIISYTRNN